MSDWFRSIKNGHTDHVRQLIRDGQNVNELDPKDKGPALYWAACSSNTNLCALLLQQRADVNLPVRWGSTALHAAADRGVCDCVCLLLAHGAIVNAQNAVGDTPLHLAAYRGHLETCRALLEKGANVHLVNRKGKTPYNEADGKGHYKILKLFDEGYSRQCRTERLSMPKTESESGHKSFSVYASSTPMPSTKPAKSNKTEGVLGNAFGITTSKRHSSEGHGAINEKFDLQRGYSAIGTNRRLREGEPWPNTGVTPVEACDPVSFMLDGSGELKQVLNELNKLQERYELLQVNLAIKQETIDELTKEKQILLQQVHQLRNTVSNLETQIITTRTAWEKDNGDLETRNQLLISEILRMRNNLDLILSNAVSAEVGREQGRDIQGTVSLSTRLNPNPDCRWRNELTARGSGSLTSSDIDTYTQVTSTTDSNNSSSFNNSGSQLSHSNRPPLCNTHKLYETLQKAYSKQPVINYQSLCDIVSTFKETLRNSIQQRMKKKFILDNPLLVPGTSYIVLGRISDPTTAANVEENFLILIQDTTYRLLVSPKLESSSSALLSTVSPHPNISCVFHQYAGPSNIVIPQTELANQGGDCIKRTADISSCTIVEYHSLTLQVLVQSYTVSKAKLPGIFVLHLLYQLLSALCHLEQHHVVHRNITMATIFLSNTLTPVLDGFQHAMSFQRSTGIGSEIRNLSKSPVEDGYTGIDLLTVGMIVMALLPERSHPVSMTCVFDSEPCDITDTADPAISKAPSGLEAVIKSITCEQAEQRISARDALIRTGLLLCGPKKGDLACEQDCSVWLQAKLTEAVLCGPVDEVRHNKRQLSVTDSIRLNQVRLEHDFLVTVTPHELWRQYSAMQRHL